jgi:hypothetical protein
VTTYVCKDDASKPAVFQALSRLMMKPTRGLEPRTPSLRARGEGSRSSPLVPVTGRVPSRALGPVAVALTALAPVGTASAAVGRMLADEAPPPIRLVPRAVALSVAPQRDRNVPYRFVATGRLVPGHNLVPTLGCQGRVVVRASLNGATLTRRAAAVRADCRFRVPLQISHRAAPGTLRVTAGFLGNTVLRPNPFPTVTVLLG